MAVTNCCWNAVQSWSKPTILDKTQSIKDNWKTKMNNVVQLDCLLSKLPRLFVDFLSAIVIIFYRVSFPHIHMYRSCKTYLSLNELKVRFIGDSRGRQENEFDFRNCWSPNWENLKHYQTIISSSCLHHFEKLHKLFFQDMPLQSRIPLPAETDNLSQAWLYLPPWHWWVVSKLLDHEPKNLSRFCPKTHEEVFHSPSKKMVSQLWYIFYTGLLYLGTQIRSDKETMLNASNCIGERATSVGKANLQPWKPFQNSTKQQRHHSCGSFSRHSYN